MLNRGLLFHPVLLESEMFAQEIFDTVVEHLRRQGHRAYKEEYGCLYRLENGDKCAVGCLIPDHLYDPDEWSGRRDSDSRPRPWQGRALPTELLPHL